MNANTAVLMMTTEISLKQANIHKEWFPLLHSYTWPQINKCNLDLTNSSNILVIAHANGASIGNQTPGDLDIFAKYFVNIIQANMAIGSAPANIYLSTKGLEIIQFASALRIAAQKNRLWDNTKIFINNELFDLSVPAPNNERWNQIFSGNKALLVYSY